MSKKKGGESLITKRRKCFSFNIPKVRSAVEQQFLERLRPEKRHMTYFSVLKYFVFSLLLVMSVELSLNIDRSIFLDGFLAETVYVNRF